MDQIFIPLYENLKKYIQNEEILKEIEETYIFARDAHMGQKRKSGEDYITHPVEVAISLCDYEVDPTSIKSALLHDVIEDTNVTYEDIKNKFGDEIADIVEGLTKIDKIQYQGIKQGQALNHQKMLLAMMKDIRVVIVKLADRLNNMRTLKYLDQAHKVKISQETLDIYTPIAHKLGMYKMKAEMEDLAFKYLYPDDFQLISKLINETKKNRETTIAEMMKNIDELLTLEGVNHSISGRAKNIYSVYNKMRVKNIEFQDIYDLLALRVIVDNVSDCYKTIGIVHSKYTPIPGRFKDYIAMPKPNMYQSLHTAVVSNGKIYEIQIRTEEMDQIAEYGVAAHWAYKENKNSNRKAIEDMAASKLRWYSELIKYNEDGDDENILNIFTDDILQANVYVFTPNNDIIDLPKGATTLDFAYRIHSRVGEKTIGAIVNGKIVQLDYVLKTGDVVEIKTSPNAFGPNENWLKIAKTSSARGKIKSFLNKKNRDLLIAEGKESLEKEEQARKASLQLTDKKVAEKFSDRGIEELEELYYEIGKGTISPGYVVNTYTQIEKSIDEKLLDSINQRDTKYYHDDINIIVEGLRNPQVKLSNCCKPIPGDEIVGYISKGTGIAVHRIGCRNIENVDKNRFINVFWGEATGKYYMVDLRILVVNRDNILVEIINSCTTYKARVAKVSAQVKTQLEAIIKISIEVLNLHELELIITNIQKIRGIYSIERIIK